MLNSKKIIWSCFVIFSFFYGSLSIAQDISTISQKTIEAFHKEIKCQKDSTDKQRAWCAVSNLKNNGEAIKIEKKQSFFGLSFAWPKGKSLEEAIQQSLHVVVLHSSPHEVRLTTLKPSNPDEEKELRSIYQAIANQLEGKSPNQLPEMSSGLKKFLSAEAEQPGYKMEITDNKYIDYQAQLASRLYLSNSFKDEKVYVVFEAAKDGVFVNIFPLSSLIN